MADTKISALPAATTPLAGTEVLPIVQSGATKKVAVSDLTAGRAVSTQNLEYTGTLTGGTGVINIGSGQVYKDASGNVGIGNGSPSQKLDVAGSVKISNGGDTYIGFGANKDNYWTTGTASGKQIWRNSSGSEFMTLDTSGNLGLGVTPSAWASAGSIFQIGSGGGFMRGDNNTLGLGNNYYFNGSNALYKNNGYATRYEHYTNTGIHAWFTAPSGTAGNAISFTQAMTLDASGRLVVGAASTSYQAEVVSAGTNIAKFGGAEYGLTIFAGGSQSCSIQNWSGVSAFSANGASAITLNTNSLERVRITAAGEFLVGTTSIDPIGGRVNGIALRPVNGLQVRSSGSSFGTPGTSGTNIGFYTDNGSAAVAAGNISSNGGTTTYATSSDYRMKENVQPMTNALDKVLSLKPVTYTWKPEFAGTNSNGQGFIAHELQAVVPDAVTGKKDEVDADGNPKYQGVDTSFLVATVVAALQELKAEFDAYKKAHP